VFQRVAVDFGCGGEQELGALVERQAERVVCAKRPDLERLNRQFQIINRAGGGRKVQNRINRAGNVDIIGNIMPDEVEVGITCQMGYVSGIAGYHVVHSNNRVSFGNKTVAQMRPQKTRAAGNQYAQNDHSLWWKPINCKYNDTRS